MTLSTLQCGMGWFPQQAGGLNRVYFNLLRALPGVGVDVRGLVAGDPQTSEGDAVKLDVFAPSSAPLLSRWAAARKAAKRLTQTHPPSLVASHFALYTFPALDVLSDYPFVVHFHGPWAHEGFVERPNRLAYRLKFLLEKAVYRKADRFVVLSEAFRDVLARDYGVPEDRIRLVPGGADTARFDVGASREEARERLGWPADRPTLLAVRRLARRMGLEHLIGAVDRIRRDVPDVLLLIAGKGPLAGELQARIDDADLGRHVRLLGYVPDDDLPLAYRAADLSVVPTVAFEGFGLITVESLAAGTPVLVTPVGGLPEVVRDLAPELVFPDMTEAAMAERLTAALCGRVQLPSAEACRQYAQARFDWHTIAQQTRAVYEEVLT